MNEYSAIHCPNPNCGDQGFSIIVNAQGEPEQEQCKFCYTNPNSVFNKRREQHGDEAGE